MQMWIQRLALLTMVMLSLTAMARDAQKACAEVARTDRPWWTKRHQAKLKEIADRKEFNVVFLGDSITHYWEDHTNNWHRECALASRAR